ncbi:MAG: glutamate decarboxylase [Flavobacteriaceae bacterium]|nr:glutamate decarboxylase [Flavobacteriaceae bacterium]
MDIDEFVESVLSEINDYLKGSELVIESISHNSLKKITDLALPLEGMGYQTVLSDINHFLRYSVRTDHPGFMNPLWGGMNITAFLGEVIASLANNSMYTYELSPVATLIEQSLIRRMCEIVGFGDGNGTLTTGGSNGNMIGMLCARYRINPLGLRTGYDSKNLVCFVSEESHYSVRMSATVLGIGLDNLISVPCDVNGKMRPEKLTEEIEFAKLNGQIPFCVIATAGTTVRGAFDPIKEISEICTDNNLWLHVDAAWGGSCLFSAKHRHLMDGIELADSLCWDAHKMMGIPLVCSAFLAKDPDSLSKVYNFTDSANYLFHEETSEVDLGRFSLQCGRRNDALKLFLAWREKGDAGWAKLVESYMDLAEYLEQKIVESENLELMSSREWTNVCVRYNIEGQDLNELNSKIREQIRINGKYMVSRSTLNNAIILRPVIANHSISKDTIDGLVNEIVTVGNEIISGIPQK